MSNGILTHHVTMLNAFRRHFRSHEPLTRLERKQAKRIQRLETALVNLKKVKPTYTEYARATNMGTTHVKPTVWWCISKPRWVWF